MKLISLVLILILLLPVVIAPNDPGHDTLYIEQTGDSILTGNLNITADTRIEDLLDIVNLQLRGTNITTSTNRIYVDSGNLYIESPNNIFFNELIGTTSTVNFGGTGDSVDVSVTGDLTVDGYINGSTYVNASVDVCITGTSTCLSTVSGGATGYTQWRLDTDSGNPFAVTNNTLVNITSGASITSTHSSGTVTIDVTDDSIDGAELADTITLDEELAITGDNFSIDTNVLFVDAESNNVGIGTTTPTSKLHLKGADDILQLNSNNAYIDWRNTSDTRIAFIQASGITATNPKFLFRAEQNIPIIFATLASERMRIAGTGNVGIGNIDPNTTLHVTGDINATNFVNASVDICITGGNCLSTSGGTDDQTLQEVTTQGTTTTDAITIDTDGDGTTTIGGNFTVDGTTLHVDSTNSRVGIGTTSPDYLLEVEQTDSDNSTANYGIHSTLTATNPGTALKEGIRGSVIISGVLFRLR